MIGFASFEQFLALPRVQALTMSVDGARLVATIAELDPDGAKFVSALWELDPAGTRPARRLTRSAKGENGAVFTVDGSVLFLSGRDVDEDDPAALWQLPPTGEARPIMTRPGGISAVRAAAQANRIVVATPTLPGEDEAGRRAERKKLKVAAALHRSSPVRYWDHDLGPDELRLLAADLDGEQPLDLTPTPGRALDEAEFAITPDGDTVVTSWFVLDEPGLPCARLVAIDTSTGAHRTLAGEAGFSFTQPAVSADSRFAVAVKEHDGSYDDIPSRVLWLVDLDSGESRELLADPDVWPDSPRFSADGTAIFFLADELQERPIFRLDLPAESVTRVTADGHHAAVQVSPDGRSLFALRDAIDSPPLPVRYDADAVDGRPVLLPCPGGTDATGTVHRVLTTASDGTTLHARLVLPAGASAQDPAPLLLWIHGGPLSSWNGWSWRWNPWLMAGRGYAVLLPDPALSTGYGAAMVQRGWGEWGGAPFTDLMTLTDAALERLDLDPTRTAAMGGSYGGYMTNWIAGHTDRFRCLVTHASVWALDQFQGTTDVPGYWVREWGAFLTRPERYDAWSPHHFIDDIQTPILVVHGDKDYRVPIGEALRLWTDLQRAGVESAYLYYPDEGHWILKPGNARLWYETVWAWLGQHVHGREWTRPELL